MATWLTWAALLAAGTVRGGQLPDPTPMQWSFVSGCEGWRVGASPIGYYTDGEGPKEALAPDVVDGAVAVQGVPTERLFMDESGLVRRGATVTQWLLSPELGVEAADYGRLSVRLRAVEGVDLNWRVQWLTESGRAACAAHRAAGSRLALPDSILAVFEAHRRGEVRAETWQRFMDEWEGGDGQEYAREARRLREEEILLRGWMETRERRLVSPRDWQEITVDLGTLAGWRGQVIALGLEMTLQPTVPDVLGGTASLPREPFVWVDQVRLSGGAAPARGLSPAGGERD